VSQLKATMPVSNSKPDTSVQDAKADKPSRWLWVPWIWLFFASTRTVSAWLAGGVGGADADLSGSPLDRIVMTILIVLGLFILGSRGTQTRRILANNKWMVALFVYIGLSIIWSNFPGISVRRGFRSIGTFVMVLVVLTERNPLEAVRALLRRLYLIHIPFSIVAIKYFRNIGVLYNWSGQEEEWTGLAIDKNSLGQVATCSGVFWLWQYLQEWPKKKITLSLLLLGMTLWLLRGSKTVHSSTAIIGFAFCAAILFGLEFVKKRAAHARRTILIGTLVLSIVAPIIYFVFQVFDTTPVQMVLEATGRNLTFTDRTLIWTDVLSISKKNPVFGVGIGALWVGPIGYQMYPMPNWSSKTPGWRPTEGHNGYVDTYAELGIIGLSMMLVTIGIGFAGALAHLESDFLFGSLRLTLLVAILVNNMTETSFLGGTHAMWFLFLLVAANLPKQIARTQTRREQTATSDSAKRSDLAAKVPALVSSPIRVSQSILASSEMPPCFAGYAHI
jgi:exopolysaccharide production protein ExoQ